MGEWGWSTYRKYPPYMASYVSLTTAALVSQLESMPNGFKYPDEKSPLITVATAAQADDVDEDNGSVDEDWICREELAGVVIVDRVVNVELHTIVLLGILA